MKQIFTQADTRPDAPTGSSIPAGWSEYPEFGVLTIRGYEGEYYPNGGYRRSPKLTAHSTSYRDRILFSTTNANQMITLRVIVSSETYDYAYIGTPDTTLNTSNYFDRMSGENDRLISPDRITTRRSLYRDSVCKGQLGKPGRGYGQV